MTISVAMESVEKFTPFGLKLWDPVYDRQITDALLVTIHPIEQPEFKTTAFRTIGNVYTFRHIYGMRDVEYGWYEETLSSPEEPRNFIVNIHDTEGRYMDTSFQVTLPLPYKGVFLSNPQASPSTTMPKGLYLYSSPVRRVPGWMALIRGELVDESNGKPAAHALVKIIAEGGEIFYGIADEKGRFIVMFSYPALVGGFGGSPSAPGYRPLSEQSWELEMEIYYSPSTQQELPGGDMPDYLSVLTQQQASIWEQHDSPGGVAVASLPLILELHKTVIVRTEGLSNLMITPNVTSP